ncbi:hypothetical protein F5J12DRAFT_808343 [Pisolithus orientalis]|uniref:uncharacterized protein n=1 Tax=Pisolithus orientalis TaxID=936130 RepID=UPI0022251425|nr:uncharacterized protein F5J12DRAFT_808343 [Pisolithus orientalis]KAI6028872.1 hypothetical protein F5J12DRAFT_808343 [Pisolithus orientalis]
MLNIRPANPKDLINIQRCNQLCLPENYLAQFWAFSIVSWPHASLLAENASGTVVGYVLASVEPVDDQPHLLIGHINSLAVLRPYRRLWLAQRLMNISTALLNDDFSYLHLIPHNLDHEYTNFGRCVGSDAISARVLYDMQARER